MSRLGNELVDLTSIKPANSGWDKTDLVILVTTGGVGYLAREAFRFFFPGIPTVAEQLESLSKLVEASGRAGAQSLKVRMSVNAKRAWQMPKAVKEAKIVGETDSSIDLEVTFAQRPQRSTRPL